MVEPRLPVAIPCLVVDWAGKGLAQSSGFGATGPKSVTEAVGGLRSAGAGGILAKGAGTSLGVEVLGSPELSLCKLIASAGGKVSEAMCVGMELTSDSLLEDVVDPRT